MKLLAAAIIAVTLLALVLEPVPTLVYLGIGLIVGGPPFARLFWVLHTYSGRADDPFASKEER